MWFQGLKVWAPHIHKQEETRAKTSFVVIWNLFKLVNDVIIIELLKWIPFILDPEGQAYDSINEVSNKQSILDTKS